MSKAPNISKSKCPQGIADRAVHDKPLSAGDRAWRALLFYGPVHCDFPLDCGTPEEDA